MTAAQAGLGQNVVPWGCVRPRVQWRVLPETWAGGHSEPTCPQATQALSRIRQGRGTRWPQGRAWVLQRLWVALPLEETHFPPASSSPVFWAADPGWPLCPGCVDGSETGLPQGLGGAFLAEMQVKRSCSLVLGPGGEGGIPWERREREGWRDRGPTGSDAVCSQGPYRCLGGTLQKVSSGQGGC